MQRIFYLFLFPLLILIGCENSASVVVNESEHWEYENPDWQNIGYRACNGNSQSPIDIDTTKTIITSNLPEIQFNYVPVELITLDNTHTIQVNAPSDENYIIFNEMQYNFAQLHFHEESEHTFDDAHTEMEMHIVHQDSLGNLLVLTHMIVEGEENEFLQKIFDNLPETVNIPYSTGEIINLNEIQTATNSYYTYAGSLTTPPCSASVQFVIFKEQMQASLDQINLFKTLHTDNRRPTQPLNNRFVLEKIN